MSLPSDFPMDAIRTLSGRRTAVELLARLKMEGTQGESFWVTSVDEVPSFASLYKKVLLKAKGYGKRNFIVLVSEGVGSEYGPALTEKIERETGIETRFARLAHVIRGGNPTLRDRTLASVMGAIAVEELLKGRSNLVMCDRRGKVIARDINYALYLDKMYKEKLKDGDLDRFSPETVEEMRREVREKRAAMARLYGIARLINL